ncbi:MAG: uracil-DNA glycosylase [Bacteroidales bacterium]|nr:uracil-DNA glycosylase [Candidatus Liminaster caballi]
MTVKIEESWRKVLQPQFDSAYFELLTDFVRRAYQSNVIYPPAGKIFEAFNRTPFDKVKVVIIGQDPYHGPNQAHGLCFSVQPGVMVPPSLVNIYKELSEEYKMNYLVRNGDLTHWANQGVLLLNATLTVEAGHAGSHQGKGWETFTDAAIAALSEQREHLVFLLWGSYAQAKGRIIDRSKHLVLEAPHPSPLSAYRGFIGCGHFMRANQYLTETGQEPIIW